MSSGIANSSDLRTSVSPKEQCSGVDNANVTHRSPVKISVYFDFKIIIREPTCWLVIVTSDHQLAKREAKNE